jgi:hypothetical protein
MYGIISARYTNPENTSVVAQTTNAGAVAISQERAALWQELQEWISSGGVVSDYAPPVLPDLADFQNAERLFKAKCISDLAFRLGKAPGALTGAELQAERTRIKNIADAL